MRSERHSRIARVSAARLWQAAAITTILVLVSISAYTVDPIETPSGAPRLEAAKDRGSPLLVPAAAHVSGAAGTDWRSDVEIFNLGPGQAFIEVALLERDRPNLDPPVRALVISPGMAYRSRDVLQSVFGLSGSAALRFEQADDDLVVTSRTYNQTDQGTYGQFIGAIEQAGAIHHGETGRIVQLTQHASSDSGYRTNLGLVSCSAVETTVKIELFGNDGLLLGTRAVTLEPYMFTQIERIFRSVTSADVEDGYAILSTPDLAGAFLAYGSVVDNRTGDPVFMPASAAVSGPVFIPASAHVAGAAGTDWRTDVELYNPGSTEAQFEIALLATDADNSAPVTTVERVGAGAAVRLEDVLQTLFVFDGTAALRITPLAGAEGIVASRTYNQTAGGTYGQFLAAIPAADAVPHGDQGLVIQLTHHRDSSTGYRTNLGLLNCSELDVEVRIDLYRSNGSLLGTLHDSLGPLMHRQINRVFRGVTNDDVDDGFAVVTGVTPGSSLIAYASVVDNSTGDPVYIPATTFEPRVYETEMDPRSTMFLLMQLLATADLEELLGSIHELGLQEVLDALEASLPDIVTVGPRSVAFDFGSGTTLDDGNRVSGRIGVYVADVTIGASSLSARPSLTFEDFRWNGQAPPVDTLLAEVDAVVDGEGRWSGSTRFTGSGSVPEKSVVVVLQGDLLWNTLLCNHFPVGGTVTLEIGDELYSFVFDPDCDGDFDYSEGTPGWDYTYAFGNPNDAHAQQHIASVDNAEIWHYAPVWFWKPEVGGETFEGTSPGVIIFQFAFERVVSEAQLLLNMPTFHWAYSRGHNFLYGSPDGVSWELLMEVPPPDYGMANTGLFNAPLPPSLTGTQEIWLRAELFSYGEMAPQGGEYTNTAELTRWDESDPGRTFQLDVRFEEE